MSSYRLRPEEMIYLLQEVGAVRPTGMTADDFGLPDGTKPAAPRTDTGTLQGLALSLASPEVVIRVWRQDAQAGEQKAWYYHDGNTAVKLVQVPSGVYELNTLADDEALLADIASSLPLRPVSAAEDFFAVLQREDLLEVRSMAAVWDEVPALNILEADGLDKAGAKELFDVGAEPEWRAEVYFSGGNVERVLRVAQGAESAWMAKPLDENITQIRVETVQAGELASWLRDYWKDVSGS